MEPAKLFWQNEWQHRKWRGNETCVWDLLLFHCSKLAAVSKNNFLSTEKRFISPNFFCNFCERVKCVWCLLAMIWSEVLKLRSNRANHSDVFSAPPSPAWQATREMFSPTLSTISALYWNATDEHPRVKKCFGDYTSAEIRIAVPMSTHTPQPKTYAKSNQTETEGRLF